MSIRISGLVCLTSNINAEIFHLFEEYPGMPDISFSNPAIINLRERFLQTARSVEDICAQNGISPMDLPTPSLRAYQWVRFLSSKKWLLEHLSACRDFQLQALAASAPRKRLESPTRIELKVYPSSYLFLCKKNRYQWRVEIHEGFIRAPMQVKQAIILSALNGRSAELNHLIRASSKQSGFLQVCQALNEIMKANNQSTKGKVYDLKEIYERLNQEYFNGVLRRPNLRWSMRPAKCRLGYFGPDSGAITLSRRLDQSDVNPLLVEYILYHEMLHQSQGIKLINGRRRAHTHEFKRAEQRFKGYQQAQKLMKSLNQQSDSCHHEIIQ